MTKYCQQPFHLNDIRYLLIKVKVILFLTLILNKETIIEIIDILSTITIWLNFINEIISNKLIMLQSDLLIIKNAQQFIF